MNNDVLDRIFARKREEIAAAKAALPFEDLRAAAMDQPSALGFRRALLDGSRPLSLIAEVKKASPSKGLIRADFDAVEVACAYREAGAQCLSVLTDVHYFQGAPEYLTAAKRATGLPCLRKDFVCDPYQIYEAKAWGGDCILLIVASLSREQLSELYACARELGLDVLVEVHDEAEAEAAVELGADLVGVNNRNLRDFTTSLDVSERVLPLLKRGLPEAVLVSESALETQADLIRVSSAGARAVLIGTTFCASPDISGKVKEVMAW